MCMSTQEESMVLVPDYRAIQSTELGIRYINPSVVVGDQGNSDVCETGACLPLADSSATIHLTIPGQLPCISTRSYQP